MSLSGGMSIGQPVSAAVGSTAEAVGHAGSSLIGAVSKMTMLSTLIELGRPTAPVMVVGMPVADATGQRVEVVGRPGSPMMDMVGSVLLPVAAIAAIGALVQANTAPPPSQDEMRAQAAAQDQQRLTALAEEDQRKAEAMKQDAQRQAFFNKPPKV